MLIGHQKNWELFLNFENLSHAYLFSGVDKIGKKRIVFEIIKLLNCKNLQSHSFYKKYPCLKCKNCLDIEKEIFPDFFLLKRKNEKKEIDIEQIRNLKSFFSFKPYNSKFKIAIIDDAHLMNFYAQNALLKLLEEPHGNKTIIFLISNKHKLLLETILSRVQEIKFFIPPKEEINNYLSITQISDDIKKELKKIDRPGIVIDIIKNPEKLIDDKTKVAELKMIIKAPLCERFDYIKKMIDNKTDDEILEILLLWTNYFQELLIDDKVNKRKIMQILKRINKTYFLISETPVNKKLALENLVLEF